MEWGLELRGIGMEYGATQGPPTSIRPIRF
jgi:hypothetical protein